MVRRQAAKRRAQQRSRRRVDLPVRRTEVKGGAAIPDGMAEAREKAPTPMQAATVQLTIGAVASATASFVSPTTTKTP